MLFRKAILIIHGFAGGCYDEEELANYLELNRAFDVYQFTLPGHDKSLGKAKYQDWIKKSEEQMEWLIKNGYNNIYLIGHSMGGVIATYLASKYKQVKKLVLGAPAFHYLNVEKENTNFIESIKKAPKLLEDYKGDELIGRFFKLNVSTLKEFTILIKEYYDCPKDVICPALILQGNKDNIVPLSSSEYIYNSLNKNIKKLVIIDGVNHDIFRTNRKEEIFEIVENFLKYNTKGGIDRI